MPGCEDCFFGGKKVPSRGNQAAEFVIVGESPGPQELYKGKAFIGPPSQLLHSVLDELLGEMKLDPLYAQAIECFPRKKDPSRLGQATKRCSGRLINELREHPRKIILALGNAALWSLTGDYNHKITRVRGKVFKSNLAELGIVATVHPSYLLRGGGNLHQFKRDIKLALDMFFEREDDDTVPIPLHGEIRAVGTFKFEDYTVLQTKKEVQDLVQKLKDVPYAGADLETDGFDPRRIDPDPPHFFGKGILCAGISFQKEFTYVIPGDLLSDELFQNDVKWCWQNGKFDLGWGRYHGLPSMRVDDDTMMLSYLLNEVGGIHDLEQLGSDWLNAPDYKAMLEEHLPSKKHSYVNIPLDILYKYQAIDANLTYWLRDPLRERVMADKHLAKVYTDIILPAVDWIYQVERNGFHVDLDEVAKNDRIIGGEVLEHEKTFNDIIEPLYGKRINIKSWQQLKPVLYECLKLGPMSWGTDIKTLEKLPKHPAVKELMKHRKVQKLHSTYIKSIPPKVAPDGRMHSSYKLHGTTTGRLSSNTPNMQNVPRDKRIRGQFVAPPGRAILEVDLSQAELRMLAQLSRCKVMLELFSAGRSIHGEVATRIFGEGWGKEQKMIAKNVNFGIVYGISAHGLSEQINVNAHRQGSTMVVTRKEAAEWLTEWGEQFPGAQAFIDECRLAPIKGLTLISAFGRKRRFNVVTREKLRDQQNEAANFPHQSGAHDITMIAGIQLEERLRTEFDALMVNEVHDCLVIDLPDVMDIIVPVANLLKATMLQIPKDWGMHAVPFEAEAEIGYRWGNLIEFDPNHKDIEPGMCVADVVDVKPIYNNKGDTYEQEH